MNPLARTALWSLVAAAPLGAQHTFPGRVFPIDQTAFAVDAVDLGVHDVNADGLCDVVALSTDESGPFLGNDGLVEVFLNGPDGLQSQGTLAGVRFPSSPVFGDIDSDGDVDLIVGSTGASIQRAEVFTNAGDGTFSGPVSVFIGPAPGFLALDDMDLDGHLDLVSAIQGTSELGVSFGDGAGSFALPVKLPLGGVPTALATGDLDGNGSTDAVVGLGTDGLAVHLGDGFGGLGLGSVYNDGWNIVDVDLADLNDDGVLDLSSIDPTGEARVALGDGAGAFGGWSTFPLQLTQSPKRIASADVDQDGLRDLVAIGGHVYTIPALGGGLFGAPVQRTESVGGYLFAARLADVTGDDVEDVVFVRFQEDLSVLPGDGDGGFSLPTRVLFDDLSRVVLGDVTGDGFPDAVTASRSHPQATVEDAIVVFHGDGAGGVSGSTAYSLGIGAAGVDLGDLDLDGNVDIVAAEFVQPNVAVLLGTGAGDPAPPVTYASSQDGWQVRVGDVNSDGDPDVVHGHTLSVTTLVGNGMGALSVDTVSPNTSLLVDFHLADLDQDGELDIYQDHGYDGVAVAWGDGAGGFSTPQIIEELNSWIGGLALGDLDEDGLVDPIIGTETTNSLVYWLNEGDRTFGPKNSWNLGFNTSVVPGDFDGDGHLDVLTGGGDLALLRGDGTGALAEPQFFDAFVSPTHIASTDWNADGRLDVVYGGWAGFGDFGLTFEPNLTGDPAGTQRFGSGSAGCEGLQGLAAAVSAVPGGSLKVTSALAPPNSVGLTLIGTSPDVAGTDLLGLGVPLHVNLPGSAFLLVEPMTTSPSGYGLLELPIPANPALESVKVHVQTLWSWGVPCAANPAGFSASNGLTVRVLAP